MTHLGRPGVPLAGGPARGALRLAGVGFKVFRRGGHLVFGLGYSHYLGLALPAGGVARPGRGGLALGGHPGGPGRVARLRRPDPYKARGIHPGDRRPPTKEGKRR